jgi:hypothetical protein
MNHYSVRKESDYPEQEVFLWHYHKTKLSGMIQFPQNMIPVYMKAGIE